MIEENGKVTPQEVKGWNWGAFVFSWIWGFGNKSYLTLLTLIPIFGLIWHFVCGFKGNDWAWQKGDYSSAYEFKKVQSTWNRAGLLAFILYIIGMVLYFMFFAAIFASIANMYY